MRNVSRIGSVVVNLSIAPARDRYGHTPLHVAAAALDPLYNVKHSSSSLSFQVRRSATVSLLLRAGAVVGAADALGRTPLHLAAGVGAASSLPTSSSVIDLLLAANAAVGAADNFGRTPLHYAAASSTASAAESDAAIAALVAAHRRQVPTSTTTQKCVLFLPSSMLFDAASNGNANVDAGTDRVSRRRRSNRFVCAMFRLVALMLLGQQRCIGLRREVVRRRVGNCCSSMPRCSLVATRLAKRRCTMPHSCQQ